MKVALVHDYLNQWGGAEEVLLALHELFPEAPIYTLFYDKELGAGETRQIKKEVDALVRGSGDSRLLTSGLQKLPKKIRNSRLLMPVYPTAIEMLDLNDYDLVISDSSSFSKGLISRPGSVHICYCHTPTRYLWDWHDRYMQEQRMGWFKRAIAVPFLSYLRLWDRWAADRVDFFIANSENVKGRIQKFYGKDAEVIYPPVDVVCHEDMITKEPTLRETNRVYDGVARDEDYFLIVSRLSAYKKVNLAVDACNRLQVPLKIVGIGREEPTLKEQAWSTVEFLGQLTRLELEVVYSKCKALIMPGLEDFGMVMVEAMSFGKPVIAFKGGGALEIVQPGKNGEFFDQETVRSLMDTMRSFETKWFEGAYQPQEVFDSVKRFDKKYFKQKMEEMIERVCKEAE